MKDLIKTLNKQNLSSPLFAEDYIDTEDVKEVAQIDHAEHRWYTVATVVFKKGDEFFGVRGPVSLKSEGMGYSDLEYPCTAFEMEKVPSVTYKRKES